MWTSFHLLRSSRSCSTTRRRAQARGLSRRAKAGFTLIELLIVIVVIGVITAAVLVRGAQFDSSTLLRSLAFSVALSVREAQVYSTAVRQSAIGSDEFGQGYGVRLSGSGATTYLLFVDLNNNQAYDAGATPSELVRTYNVARGYQVSRYCATPSNGSPEQCSDSGAPQLTSLTVLFRRPNPDPRFITNVSGQEYSSAYIQVKSLGNGATRNITIQSTGQITVGPPGT